MKKILVFSYLKGNLGDDLFIKQLITTYINNEIYVYVPENSDTKILNQFNNIKILNGVYISQINPQKYDIIVNVGGSIFIESEYSKNELNEFKELIDKAKQKNIPFFYISSNFGPYKTQEYFKLAEQIFSECQNICFRDKQSYQLFKKIKSVSYAPDLIFSLKRYRKTSKIKKTVGISVIKLTDRNNLYKQSEKYEILLEKTIREFLDKDFKVYLFAFCENEGDIEEAEKIQSKFSEKEKVIIVKYNGNDKEFIETYSKMEYMICTRFHSLVLSMLANQKVYNLVYSNKNINLINDYNLFKKVLMIEDIEVDTKIVKQDFQKVNILKTKMIIIKSKKQLQELNKTILKKE